MKGVTSRRAAQPAAENEVTDCQSMQLLAREMAAQLDALETERQRLVRLTETDPMTGLANRSRFIRDLEARINGGEDHESGFIVLVLDFDDFKQVNDTLGEEVGDLLMTEVADRLKGLCRERDCLARIGGDEFGLILPLPTDPESPLDYAAKLLQAIEEPMDHRGRLLHVQASAGFSHYPWDATDAASLLRYAFIALHNAKAGGRGSCMPFDEPLRLQLENRRSLETALHKAITSGDIEPWFQPVMDVTTERIHSLEILARWTRPGHGPVSPVEFVPLAEDMGLIKEMTAQMFIKAAPWIHKWVTTAGLTAVSLNISPREMAALNFVDDLQDILVQSNFPRDCLTVEITENLLHNNFDLVSKHIIKLAEQGTRVALDDFGVGYSNISGLKDLPIDVVKLDRSLIIDINEDARSAHILASLMGLFKGLDLKVIAEGIETREQAAALQALGCRYMQGYLWARPMTAEDLDHVFAGYQGRD